MKIYEKRYLCIGFAMYGVMKGGSHSCCSHCVRGGKTYRDTMKIRAVIVLSALLMAAATLPATAQQKGRASYYAKKFHGHRMSSGKPYDSDSMFCAHRTYPFGTLLKVTNLTNNRSVIVKVMDRGPFSHGRIIDLSHAAAKELDMLRAGVVMVSVTPYKKEPEVPYWEEDDDELPDIDFDFIFEDDYGIPWILPEETEYDGEEPFEDDEFE